MDDAQVSSCYMEAWSFYNQVLHTVKTLNLEDELDMGFTNFKLRDRGRYDMVIPSFPKGRGGGQHVKKKRGRKRKDAGSDEPKEEKEEKEEAVVDPFAFLASGPDCPWLPAVKRILGNDCVFAHLGCIMSLPGSTVSLQGCPVLEVAWAMQPADSCTAVVPRGRR